VRRSSCEARSDNIILSRDRETLWRSPVDSVFSTIVLALGDIVQRESMQQVVPFLWIGGISAAYDTAALQKNGIHSVLSALNGDIEVHPVRVAVVLETVYL
jgi:hypothetical protein